MGNGVSRGFRSTFCGLGAALGVAGLGVSLSGCPVAAELEDRNRFIALDPGPEDCKQPLPDGPSTSDIACDYKAALVAHCARAGCHNDPDPPSAPAAQLNLVANDLLIARILEVPARHEIGCSGMGTCNLSAPQCDDCRRCSTVDLTGRLLTKANIPGSWIIQKMEAFNPDTPTMVPEIGCGDAMPLPPGNTVAGGFTAAKRTCLTDFFTWIANNGRACALPMGGSGGGAGSGGAGSGGAGAGGTGGT